ncbi:unnamed protein product [Echinostoma caproni]|uniref:Aquaporin-9 n=1 Tax=Echinostoma caproni TaxID=27848 RepID=A0A183A6R5_9TREM|nr:unnamed protein product [Echinostoma caproni]
MRDNYVTVSRKLDKIRLTSNTLIRACIAEFCGTAIMIIFGCGVIAQVTLGDHGKMKHGNMNSISWNWGWAVTLGVFFAGGNGSGNINPAISLAFALIGRLPWKRVPWYTLSQTIGAFVGASVVLLLNLENIRQFADEHNDGLWLVNTTGNIFVTNPWVSHMNCLVDQIAGTALLTAGALAIVEKNTWAMPDYLHPLMFGVLVCALVQAYALNAGCALNPARDFGPRLMLACFEGKPLKSEPQCKDYHRTSRSRVARLTDRIRLTRYPMARACLAECCGTAIMVIFGCGVLAQVELGSGGMQKHGTFISISLGWGLAVCLGVFFAGINGSGNINPAITLAWAILGRIPYKRVPFYTISQIFGAFLGAVTIYGVYWEKIWEHATVYDGGELFVNTTGNIFVTNPHASHWTCFIDQVMGTALLAACALAIVDRKTWNLPDFMHPISLGLMVYALVGCFALNAGCALNPARDLGPRLVLLICGWGSSAFTSGNYYFWIPIVGPYLGAVIGALLYELTIGIHVSGRKTESAHADGAQNL